MLGVEALSPKSETFLNQSSINAFAELYRGDTEDFGHEVYQLKRLLARSEDSSQHFGEDIHKGPTTKFHIVSHTYCFMCPE